MKIRVLHINPLALQYNEVGPKESPCQGEWVAITSCLVAMFPPGVRIR
jgi:hypothetical protein